MAFMTARNGVIAVVQGAAETGPRALGHRSILANACNVETREMLNARVKYREAIRPLAPMMTLEAATRWFDLSPGASDADYNAYNYMVLTARARPGAAELMPAVVHEDGTARLQIVRAESDTLIHAYLKAVGTSARSRGGGQHFVQRRRAHRSNRRPSGHDPSSLEGTRRPAVVRGGRRGLCGLAERSWGDRAEPFSRLVRVLAPGKRRRF